MATVSRVEERVLRYIDSCGSMHMSHRYLEDAAEALRCPADVVTTSVDRLVAAGLLVREPLQGGFDELTNRAAETVRPTMAGHRFLASSI